MEIQYSHPDQGLQKTLAELKRRGIEEDSRNGKVRRFAEPVMLINTEPTNRVSLSVARDANPFFHFMEALWMLGGMNEVAPMAFFNSGISQYSDNGRTLRGTAYGYKWRSHFGYDQLAMAIERLKANPQDRRVVLTMWDPVGEWRNPDSKDLSCNLQVIFGTRTINGVVFLDMEVTNRSNDIVFGCLGSNVFHFSFLLEYVAFHTGYQVGRYYQVAFNLHGYTDNPAFKRVYESASAPNAVENDDWFRWEKARNPALLREMGLTADPTIIANFVRTGDPGGDPYLQHVGVPLYEAYRVFKLKSKGLNVPDQSRIGLAIDMARQCADEDLAFAGAAWLGRRLKTEGVQNDG